MHFAIFNPQGPKGPMDLNMVLGFDIRRERTAFIEALDGRAWAVNKPDVIRHVTRHPKPFAGETRILFNVGRHRDAAHAASAFAEEITTPNKTWLLGIDVFPQRNTRRFHR